jgi:hypothetical protein
MTPKSARPHGTPDWCERHPSGLGPLRKDELRFHAGTVEAADIGFKARNALQFAQHAQFTSVRSGPMGEPKFGRGGSQGGGSLEIGLFSGGGCRNRHEEQCLRGNVTGHMRVDPDRRFIASVRSTLHIPAQSVWEDVASAGSISRVLRLRNIAFSTVRHCGPALPTTRSHFFRLPCKLLWQSGSKKLVRARSN